MIKMLAEDFYYQNLSSLKSQLKILLKKKSIIGWLRLVNIFALIVAIYFLWSFSWIYLITVAIILIIVFTRFILTDSNNKSSISHTKYLIEINEDEIKALSHNYHHFNNGIEHLNVNHVYANDIDIFGNASLFQFCNRTTSQIGSNTLADWLLYPATTQDILLRHEAIKELSAKTKFRQAFQAYGKEKKIQISTESKLKKWIISKQYFTKNNIWFLISYAAPIAMLTIIVFNIFDMVNNHTRNYFLLTAAILAAFIAKKISPIHQQVSKISEELEVLSNTILSIENENFKSTLLQSLQSQFIFEGTKTSTQIKKLNKILGRMDLRYNPIAFIPLDIILQWDLQQGIALEKWKYGNSNSISQWFKIIGEFEALVSFATITFNNPEWCFPNFKTPFFYIEGTKIGHPLIHPAKRINNIISIKNSGKIMLITGSNMAGKSTYLRSIGINVVLAMAGAPVCANTFTLSSVSLISSMRIADNLEESTSTFYAELKKLKLIIDKVNDGEKIFILLDEILRGTNSLDRHTGAEALIKQMIKHKAACIIATHDIDLAKMQQYYPNNILNYHFDAQINKEELFFDYQIKEGICTSLNASILMKKIGIEL